MAIGSYGSIRVADVSPSDVEILLNYSQNRLATSNVTLTKLDSSEILTPVFHNSETGGTSGVELLGGVYNLRLSSTVFDQLGIYNLYIRPKQIRTIITDCGVLSSLPSVRGIVIDITNVDIEDRNKFTPQGLVGYRIEYIDIETQQKVTNFYKIVTSSFYCEPITTNLTNTSQKSIRYRYTDTPTNLLFLTVTPSSSPSTRANIVPFIGQPSQTIILTNTFFNPLNIEIELVEHDISTLALGMYGNQTKALSSGIYTIYDTNNNIYKQFDLYEIKDEFNETLYEVREERTDIDQTLNFDDITE